MIVEVLLVVAVAKANTIQPRKKSLQRNNNNEVDVVKANTRYWECELVLNSYYNIINYLHGLTLYFIMLLIFNFIFIPGNIVILLMAFFNYIKDCCTSINHSAYNSDQSLCWIRCVHRLKLHTLQQQNI